jgi:hypothetical protein
MEKRPQQSPHQHQAGFPADFSPEGELRGVDESVVGEKIFYYLASEHSTDGKIAWRRDYATLDIREMDE